MNPRPSIPHPTPALVFTMADVARIAAELEEGGYRSLDDGGRDEPAGRQFKSDADLSADISSYFNRSE